MINGTISSLLLGLCLLAGAAQSQVLQANSKDDSRPGCCRHESADIVQWHKNADLFYGQFKPKEAVAELLKILQVDGRNFDAMIKLARAYIDIGDLIPENNGDWKERKQKEYLAAQQYARKAVQLNPNSTWSHFWLAAAVGSVAVISPTARQVELSGEIRDAVERSLALDTNNGSAYHIYGLWHRKMAEIGGASRILASVLYGKSPPTGSLEKSVELLKKAISLNPTVIVSRLELARTYVARSEWPAARSLLKSIPELPVQFSDDARHKQRAEELLEEIKDR